MSLQDELLNFSRQAGGAIRTREHRERIVWEFCGFLREQNIQTRHVRELKVKQIRSYIAHLQARGLKIRTLQNTASALRVLLRTAGRGSFADLHDLSNQALGIAGASRKGTHEAVTAEQFGEFLQHVSEEKGGEGVAAAASLQWILGLRCLEAIRADRDTLKRWMRELPSGKIHVILGTKGGRPRYVTVLDAEALRQVLMDALRALRSAGRDVLVVGKGGTLKSAYELYHRILRKHGLRGTLASHGLRYAWARRAIEHYLQQQGMVTKDARALVSQDLGHGDGRGRYVASTYYRKGA